MAHIHEKIDFTVEVFIVHNNKVLLRMHDKYKLWLSVGGHIELDEDPNQAAIREVREEVGLTITLISPRELPRITEESSKTELIPPWFVNRHPVSETHEHVSFVYLATSESDSIKAEYESDLSEDCVWASVEDLKSMDLKEDIRYYALTALEILKS